MLEDGITTTEYGKTKFLGCIQLTRKKKYAVGCVLLSPLVFLLFLAIGLMINAAVVNEKYQRLNLDPTPSFIDANQSVIWERAERLGAAIKIKTISYNQTWQNMDELSKLNTFITNTYPYVHNSEFIEKNVINNISIIFRVNGTDHTEKPYMLCAHLDVVPEGDLSQWDCDPFLGEIVLDRKCDPIMDRTYNTSNAYVFGRGAIDDKHSVFGILEALEYLVSSGHQPRRTFYVAFGHDEEVSGNQGAARIKSYMSDLLKENNEVLDFILDEGNSVYQDVVPGVDIPIAMIGVTEKGTI